MAGDSINGTAQLKINNCKISHGAVGLFVKRSQISEFNSVLFQTNEIGVLFETETGLQHNVKNTFNTCAFDSNETGVKLRNALVTTFNDCTIQVNTEIGIDCEVVTTNSVRWLAFNESYIERNGVYNAKFVAGDNLLLGELSTRNTYMAIESGDSGKILYRNVNGSSFFDSFGTDKIEISAGTSPHRMINVWSHAPEVWPLMVDEVVTR